MLSHTGSNPFLFHQMLLAKSVILVAIFCTLVSSRSCGKRKRATDLPSPCPDSTNPSDFCVDNCIDAVCRSTDNTFSNCIRMECMDAGIAVKKCDAAALTAEVILGLMCFLAAFFIP